METYSNGLKRMVSIERFHVAGRNVSRAIETALITGVKVAEFKDFSYVSSDLETLWHAIGPQNYRYQIKK